MPNFCQCVYFVDANNLWTLIFNNDYLLNLLCFVCIMITINLSKPSQVLTAKNLPITASKQ